MDLERRHRRALRVPVLGRREHGALLGYLNHNSYTAVVAGVLDMFPEEPFSDGVVGDEDEPLKELHRFYDLSDLREEAYESVGDVGNVLTNPDVPILRGGTRHTLFGLSSLLIKHPLIFLDGKLKPMDLSEHWVGDARLTDFTGVLLHYKLLNGLYAAVRREVESRNYPNRWRKYDRYLKVLEAAPNSPAAGSRAHRFRPRWGPRARERPNPDVRPRAVPAPGKR